MVISILIVAIILICFVIHVSNRRLRNQYMPLVRDHFPLLIMHIAALSSALYSSQFVFEAIFSLFPIADLWERLPFVAITLKIALSLSLYMIFNAITIRIYTVPVEKAYSAFALITGAVSQLVAIFNLFLATLTALLFLGTIGFAFAKRSRHKSIIFHILLIVAVVCVALYLIRAPIGLYRDIIFSDFISSFVLAVIILQYFFMYLRLRTLGLRLIKNNGVWYTIIASYIVAVIALFIFYDPFIATVTKRIDITEIVDQSAQSHVMHYRSNIGKETGIAVNVDTRQGQELLNPSSAIQTVELAYMPYYTVEYATEAVGEYRSHRLTIGGERSIQSIDILLTAQQKITIIESDTAYRNIDSGVVQFYVGRNPQLPIVIEFFMSASPSFLLTTEMTIVPITPLADMAIEMNDSTKRERAYILNTDGMVIVRSDLAYDRN